MTRAPINILRSPGLRIVVLLSLGILTVYRIGFWTPLPGVDQTQLVEAAKNASVEANGGQGAGR